MHKVIVITTIAVLAALVSVQLAEAATYETSIYTVEESGGITFTAKQQLTYTSYSDHFNVPWTALYINVLTCCGSLGTELDCMYCSYARNYPAPYTGYMEDSGNPSTLSYENTPAWADVYVPSEVTNSNFYWGSTTAIKFDDRAVSILSYCPPGGGEFSLYAGVRVYYHPNSGFYEASY